ncbi:MAG TPA: FoF1 ATP synthase subunit gamma [Caulobacteraceae bacterium]|nr:FoF1 ATP synthase subunit gamma [Caulobacteraceae bacterium]
MSALSETQARIDSVGKLGTVVGAMRGIAATHAGRARAALAGYQAYAKIVAAGLARAAALLEETDASPPPQSGENTVAIVFTAEHGFAGAFSERVLDTAKPRDRQRLFIAGARGVSLAEQRGLHVDWSTPMASQAAAVGAVARRVADRLYALFVEERMARVDVVYACPVGAADFAIAQRPLLPIDVAAIRAPVSGPPPLVNLPPRKLVELLVGEYVFAELALAALESFASENAARLATMESARLNIDQKLQELSGQERLLRQEQITAEVQDVVAGALAANASGARRPGRL